MDIFKQFRFEAAHKLPNVPADHKCGRLHGHSFVVTVYLSGPVGAETGWVADFADIKKVVKPVINRLDHRYLNEIGGLDNPTSEHIARWLWKEIVDGLPHLIKVCVSETCTTGCEYKGEDEHSSFWKAKH